MTWDLAERFAEQARTAGCVLVVTADGLTVGHWDRMRLEQVLTNLITNALKSWNPPRICSLRWRQPSG
jgi:signal transduction histidine kinase